MKFPFDFSITLVFRLIFPGMVLAIALLPFIAWLLQLENIDADPELAVPIAAVVLGWIVVLLDQPIYMLFEGRRYWPVRLRTAGIARQKKLLNSLLKRSDEARKAGSEGVADELDIQTLDFPLDDDGEPYARYPTRLGNLLTAFETYPFKTYRIDAVLYWYRLWVKLDKDTRDMMDEQQSVADSALYVCFALSVSAGVALLYFAAGLIVPSFTYDDPLRLSYLPSPIWNLVIALILALLARGVYLASLGAQRSYGELFKALFDQNRDKLVFVDDVTGIAVKAGGSAAEAASDKYHVAARFIRWHQIRPDGEAKNHTPESWKGAKKVGL